MVGLVRLYKLINKSRPVVFWVTVPLEGKAGVLTKLYTPLIVSPTAEPTIGPADPVEPTMLACSTMFPLPADAYTALPT